jgi:hypothetical protein
MWLHQKVEPALVMQVQGAFAPLSLLMKPFTAKTLRL